MTKGALYRHYKSKRDIFDSIVKRMEQQDSEQARENEVPEESIEKTPEEYQNVSFDDFVEYSKSMFEYWTEDDFASSFRKMLTIEQFRSEGDAEIISAISGIWTGRIREGSVQKYENKRSRGECS